MREHGLDGVERDAKTVPRCGLHQTLAAALAALGAQLAFAAYSSRPYANAEKYPSTISSTASLQAIRSLQGEVHTEVLHAAAV